MARAVLRKVGGSVMMAVPPAYLDRTGLGPTAEVSWEVVGDRLVIRPSPAPARHALADFLAECDPSEPLPRDPEWTQGGEAGGELV